MVENGKIKAVLTSADKNGEKFGQKKIVQRTFNRQLSSNHISE